MNKHVTGILLAVWMISGSSMAFAEPERMAIKDRATAAKQNASRAALNNIDLEDIEDPTAKRAIGEILNYLNLQSKR